MSLNYKNPFLKVHSDIGRLFPNLSYCEQFLLVKTVTLYILTLRPNPQEKHLKHNNKLKLTRNSGLSRGACSPLTEIKRKLCT